MGARLRKILMTFDGFIACVLLCMLTATLFYEVITRYCFGLSSALNSELAGLAFIWFVYLSISYVTGQRNHIVVDLASLVFPKSWLKYIDVFADAVFLAFCLILCWNGARLVLSTLEFPLSLAISGISMAVPYSIVPLAFGIMSVRLMVILAQDISAVRRARAKARGDDHA